MRGFASLGRRGLCRGAACCVGLSAVGLAMSPAMGEVTFGVNLLTNPGAEAGPASPDGSVPVPIPGWTLTQGFTVIAYDTPGFPTLLSPGSTERGEKFFAGGPGSGQATATQVIELGGSQPSIDLGRATYTLRAWLGGQGSQDDTAIVALVFNDAAGQSIGTAALIGPTAGQRAFITSMLLRSRTGTVPPGTRSIAVVITMSGTTAPFNNGYADDLSFQIEAPCIADWDANGEVEPVDIRVFFDAYRNGSADADGNGETEPVDIRVFFDRYREGC